jgi:nucleoside-diphosphate-sugar epimerase/phosphohistidine swiveling domain-containing protein
MKVLVTGATGVFGRDVVGRLVRDGHEVVGMSRRVPASMPAGMTHVAADIQDSAAVSKAMAGCDAVVHLAWTVTPHKDDALTRAVDVGGTTNVLDAMEANGVRRLVQASSVMSYGALPDNPEFLKESDPLRANSSSLYSYHKRLCEGLIAERDIDALMIRATSSIGRRVDGIGEEAFTGPVLPGIKGPTESRMQFVHAEDIGRLFALAVTNDWTGPVNLSPADTVTMREIADIIGRRYVEAQMSTLQKIATAGWKLGLTHVGPAEIDSLLWFPIVANTRLTEELGFSFGWSTRECVEDLARVSKHVTWVGGRRVTAPWLVGYHGTGQPAVPDRAGRVSAAPEGVAGEFDSLVNPAFPVFTSNNIAEAFPGPMTALSLELGYDAMRVSGATSAEILALPAELTKIMREEALGVFANTIYANTTVVYQMARAMPGYDPKQWDTLIFGGGSDKLGEPTVVLGARDKARLARVFLPKLAKFGTEARRVDATARAVFRTTDQLAQHSDEQLRARLGLLKDTVTDSWVIASNLSAFVPGLISAVERLTGAGYLATTRGGADELASAATVRAVREVAEMLRDCPVLQTAVREAIATEAPLAALADTAPELERRVKGMLDECGHRGPRETELSSLPYADRPGLFLDAALTIAARPAPAEVVGITVPRRYRALVERVHTLQRHRELARDAAMRTTHAYRVAAREWGGRLARRGVLDRADDAFHLTLWQLLDPPADAKQIVARRRAERERLAALRVPKDFVDQWEPEQEPIVVAATGDILAGIGVSSGAATGRVRVMTADDLGDLEPGEVLVATYTDTGWTPLFAAAEAVVTQVGGMMSHAAVVARECGIPCVVNVDDVAHRLVNGQLIEVDGAAGTVRVIEG